MNKKSFRHLAWVAAGFAGWLLCLLILLTWFQMYTSDRLTNTVGIVAVMATLLASHACAIICSAMLWWRYHHAPNAKARLLRLMPALGLSILSLGWMATASWIVAQWILVGAC